MPDVVDSVQIDLIGAKNRRITAGDDQRGLVLTHFETCGIM
jgi:hypothetical protein